MAHSHHHALLAALTSLRFGEEDFTTYPNGVYPAYPLGPPRWYNDENTVNTACSVAAGEGIVRARHNATDGLRYNSSANTAGKYVRVLLSWYPGIPDEERRLFLETNSVKGKNVTLVLFFFAGNSAQVGLSTFGADSHEISTQELTPRPNNALQLSTSEPTWLELFVPDNPGGYVEARTWGQSQPRPTAAGFSVKMTDLTSQYGALISQYGPISLAGQLVLRSIQTDVARILKIAILSTP